MKPICQHCGTPYVEAEGSEGFCCGGCAQVSRLIREEGLEGYYALQDRVGRPPDAAARAGAGAGWAEAVQAEVEASSTLPALALSLTGMSCIGCVWLVERLGRRVAGVRSVRVSLERNTVVINWELGAFSLASLVEEWQRFGYRAEASRGALVERVSPLAWRTLLCAVFGANGLLLSAPEYFKIVEAAPAELFGLLAVFCIFLSFAVGATFFVLPVYRGFQVKSVHYDLLTSAGLSLAFVMSMLGNFFDEWVTFPAWIFPLLVLVALGARWGHGQQWERREPGAEMLEPWVLCWVRAYSIGVLVLSGLTACFLTMETAIGGLLASSLYPIARSVSYSPSRLIVGAGFVFGVIGFILVIEEILGMVGAVLWMSLSGFIWSALFLHSKRTYPNNRT